MWRAYTGRRLVLRGRFKRYVEKSLERLKNPMDLHGGSLEYSSCVDSRKPEKGVIFIYVRTYLIIIIYILAPKLVVYIEGHPFVKSSSKILYTILLNNLLVFFLLFS